MFWSGFRGGDRCLCTRQIFVTGYMSPSGSRQPTRLRSRGSLRRTRSVRTTLGNIIAMSPPANLHFLRLRACLFSTCKPAYSQGMHLTGVHLTGVPLTGVHLTGVHRVIVLEEQKRAQGDPYLLGLLNGSGMASRPKRTWTS